MQPADLAKQLELTPVGADTDVPNKDTFSVGVAALNWWVPFGDFLIRGQLVSTGDYLVDCLSGSEPEHVWRAASVEIVTP